MTIPKLTSLVAAIVLFTTCLPAQDKLNIKFGKVSADDFKVTAAFDSGASAIVIADIGKSVFEGNTKGYFSLNFRRHTRIKILNKNGLDAANVQIPLYTDGSAEEKLINLKAVTYNLEGNTVVETKLDDASVFKDKLNRKLVVKKFTLPAAKEGSIIEFSYSIVSDFLFNLQSWEFQGDYPRLWSEYEVNIPEFFRYVFLSQGSKAYAVNTQETSYGNWSVLVGSNSTSASEVVNLNGNIGINRWAVKNMPSIKEESYTSTINNYITKVEFQLSSVQFPNSARQDIMGTWAKAADNMMKNENFGEDLGRANNWLDDDIKIITAACKTPLDKAKGIYAFVKKNFTCTSKSGTGLQNNIKTVFKNKSGNVAEINLLLTAMLMHENIDTHPMILSTKNHGYAHDFYPLMDRFNYVISFIKIDSAAYYLDASSTTLGFGMLHWKCYNGHARLVDPKNPAPYYLDADSLRETKFTNVIIINAEKGKWEGGYTSTPGLYESVSIKDDVKDKGEEAFFKKIKNGFTGDIKLLNMHIDSLSKDTDPVSINYDFDLNLTEEEDIIYFNPMMSDIYKENPFKSAVRQYPVEMPYSSDEIYVANIDIPDGYVVDEMPKSARVSFNESDGMFEYLISSSGESIQFRCRLKLNKANFMPEEYESLRDFFGYVVKKESGQIVFKKKK